MASYRRKSAEAPIPTGRQPGRPLAMEMELPGSTRPFDPINSEYRPVELPDYDNTDKKLYNALAAAQEECRKMAVAYRDLNAKYEDSQRQLTSARIEQQMYKERYEQLQQQVVTERSAGNEVVNSLTQQLAELEAKYRASEEARERAEARITELESTLAQTQEELARVTRERDALKAENEQLRAIVELNSPEKTKALLDQNLTLAEQLKAAQERIAQLESMQAGADDQNTVLTQQLDEARNEANRLRDEMSGIYEENMGYRRRVSELTERLNNIEADLDKTATQAPVDPALAEENELLREVIAKQRRSLAMQEEGRKLLIET
jgi:chromosome segregation ATPase